MWSAMTGWDRRGDAASDWLYSCPVSGCGYVLGLPERVSGRSVPLCGHDRSHGPLVLDEDA